MEKLLGKFAPNIYALLRIVAGFTFLLHGTQKLWGFPPSGRPPMPLPPLMMAAGVIELVAGALILVGFFTSLAAFIASGQMAVAYFMTHQPKGALPIQNGGEAAVLFCFVFLFFAAHGSGLWSLDAFINKRKNKRAVEPAYN